MPTTTAVGPNVSLARLVGTASTRVSSINEVSMRAALSTRRSGTATRRSAAAFANAALTSGSSGGRLKLLS